MLEAIEKESFYSPEDLAKKFKVSLSSIYKLIRSGELPHIRLGKIYRIPVSDLQNYLSAKKSRSTRGKIPEAAKNFIRLIEHSPLSKNIKEVRLFGSYARGDYHPDSDVDLLIILKEKSFSASKNITELSEKAMEEIDYKDLLSIHEMSEKEWVFMSQKKYLLAQVIEEEGLTLWKNRQYSS